MHPRELEEFGKAVPTTWNLGKQCVDPVRVSDEALKHIYGVLGMPDGGRQGQVLIQSEVLNFTRWLPYHTREEFDNYRTEHPELEPFLPYNFGAPGQAYDKEAGVGGGAPQGYSFFVTDSLPIR